MQPGSRRERWTCSRLKRRTSSKHSCRAVTLPVTTIMSFPPLYRPGPNYSAAVRSSFCCGQRFSARGPDAHYTLTVGFLDAATGTTRRITLPEGKTLDVRIPAGVQDGQIIRLKGQGMPGLGSGGPGDALVEIAVAPHPARGMRMRTHASHRHHG
ncbi:MAG: hypothetical protein J0H99_05340 [Rhodospirillales bacterium]|nr:hypothetical protein [Rhodospirillales bacterium]